MDDYKEKRKLHPSATFTLRSEHNEDLKYLTTEKKGQNTFKASIQIQVPNMPPDM